MLMQHKLDAQAQTLNKAVDQVTKRMDNEKSQRSYAPPRRRDEARDVKARRGGSGGGTTASLVRWAKFRWRARRRGGGWRRPCPRAPKKWQGGAPRGHVPYHAGRAVSQRRVSARRRARQDERAR